jgi:transcriptional regulator with XRE-family HTH domain
MHKRIKKARESLRLTQVEAAEKAGVSEIAWQNWEAGRRKPSPKNQKKIAAVLGVDLWELYQEEDKATAPPSVSAGELESELRLRELQLNQLREWLSRRYIFEADYKTIANAVLSKLARVVSEEDAVNLWEVEEELGNFLFLHFGADRIPGLIRGHIRSQEEPPGFESWLCEEVPFYNVGGRWVPNLNSPSAQELMLRERPLPKHAAKKAL